MVVSVGCEAERLGGTWLQELGSRLETRTIFKREKNPHATLGAVNYSHESLNGCQCGEFEGHARACSERIQTWLIGVLIDRER